MPKIDTPRTWFITGTSTGIGRALTERLLARGERVAATARDTSALADLSTDAGDRLWTARLDVTDAAAIRRVVDAAFQELVHIDVVVSNAGYGLVGAAEEVSDEQLHRQIETNLLGSIRLVRACLPHLREQGFGRIVQLSSMGGQVAWPNLSIYHTTKWGIEGFFEALTQEVAALGIQTTVVEPGVVPTDFGGRSMDHAPAHAGYERTASGEMRRTMAAGRAPGAGSDANKVADAIIDSADQDPAPRRLTLGSDAYHAVRGALQGRLAELETQEVVARSTDADEIATAAS